jgi:hypothetical protein
MQIVIFQGYGRRSYGLNIIFWNPSRGSVGLFFGKEWLPQLQRQGAETKKKLDMTAYRLGRKKQPKKQQKQDVDVDVE